MSRTPRLTKVEQIQPRGLPYEDAAKYLGCAVKSLRNRVSEGTFPVKPRRLWNKPVFLREELDRYLDGLPADTESLVVRKHREKATS